MRFEDSQKNWMIFHFAMENALKRFKTPPVSPTRFCRFRISGNEFLFIAEVVQQN